MTASCGAFYRVAASPSYGAAKSGVVNFMRSIAGNMFKNDGIRVNAICPSTVRTNLLEKEAWDSWGGDQGFVPLEKIASTVLMLIDGDDKGGKTVGSGKPLESAANGKTGKLNGVAVELSGKDHYYREQIPFCDDLMERTMGSTDKENF